MDCLFLSCHQVLTGKEPVAQLYLYDYHVTKIMGVSAVEVYCCPAATVIHRHDVTLKCHSLLQPIAEA